MMMLIQARYKHSQDSLRLLEQLENIEELKQANIKIFLDGSYVEDQKLLRHLSARLAEDRARLRAHRLKTVVIAAVLSLSSIVFALTALL